MHRLRGRLLRFAVLGYLAGLVLGYGAGRVFQGARLGIAAAADRDHPARAAGGAQPARAARPAGERPQAHRGPGLLQATSLPFIVAATQIGVVQGKLSSVTAATLVSAGLLSVLIFPLLALGLLGRNEPASAQAAPAPAVTQPERARRRRDP